MGFNRTTPDSATPWQYSRSGSNPNWTTTVIDPLINRTTYTMHEVVSTTTNGQASQSTYTYYETLGLRRFVSSPRTSHRTHLR
jgi:hypothetical protein